MRSTHRPGSAPPPACGLPVTAGCLCEISPEHQVILTCSAGAGAGSWVCYRLPPFCSQVGCSVLSWQGGCVSTFTRTRVSANRNCRICVPIEHGKKNYFFFANSLSSHMDFNSTRNKFSPTKARFPRLVLYVTVDIASG